MADNVIRLWRYYRPLDIVKAIWHVLVLVVLNGIRLQLACYGSYNTTFFTPYSSHAALHLVELTLTYLSSVLRIQLGDLHNLIVNIIHIYWRKLSY